MVFDQTGSLAATKRHDYLPFGEELYAGQGSRTTALGYTGGDGVRQQFTSKERDNDLSDYFNNDSSNLELTERNIPMTPLNALKQVDHAHGNIGGLVGRVIVLTKQGLVTY